MLDKIIVRHLAANKRLVVPEFGAFIRKDGEGDVVFVEFLKKDDQVFSSLVSREFALDQDEARAAIDEYVLGVRQSVGAHGGYVIEGLGEISADANGMYSLRYDPAAVGGAVEVGGSIGGSMGGSAKEEAKKDTGADFAPETPNSQYTGHRTPPRFEVIDAFAEAREKPEAEDVQAVAEKEEFSLEYKETPVIPEPRKLTINDIYPPTESASAAPDRAGADKPGVNQGASDKSGAGRASSGRPGADQAASGRPGAGKDKATPARPAQNVSAQNRPVDYRRKGKRINLVLIIAIAAAVIAIGSLVYGMLVNNNPSANIRPTNPEPVENVVTDVAQPESEQTN